MKTKKKVKNIEQQKSAAMDDPRFENVTWDPKFRRIPKRERKVKIDNRFKEMFTDPKFNVSYKMDSRGREMKKSTEEDMRKFYDLSSSESEAEEGDDEGESEHEENKDGEQDEKSIHDLKRDGKRPQRKEEVEEGSESGSETHSNEGEEETIGMETKLKFDLARGEGNVASSSSSEDEDEEEAEEVLQEWWGEMDKDAVQIDDATSRLAVCNMNWDRMRARDILILFNSFKPPQGVINSVSIYTSEFGKQRLAEENVSGPKEILEMSKELADKGKKPEKGNLSPSAEGRDKEEEQGSDNDQDSDYEQKQKFIPADMTFDDDPKEVTKEMGDVSAYQPKLFFDSAQQMSTVSLTWEEADPERFQRTQKAFIDETADLNWRDLIASGSSSEEEEEGKEMAGKYKDIFKEALSSTTRTKSLFAKLPSATHSTTQEDTLDIACNSTLHPTDHFLHLSGGQEEEIHSNSQSKKNKAKNKRKKSEEGLVEKDEDPSLNLLTEEKDNFEVGKHHFDLAKIMKKDKMKKRKKKSKSELTEGTEGKPEADFQLDASDPRFSAVFESHLYSIDPSDANFKRTSGMESLLEKKVELRKRKAGEREEEREERKDSKLKGNDRKTSLDGIRREKASSSSLTESLKHKVAKLEKLKKVKKLSW